MCGVVLDNPLIAHRVQLEERLPRLILHECHSYVEVGMPEKIYARWIRWIGMGELG